MHSPAGQSIAMFNEETSVAAVMQKFVSKAEQALKRMSHRCREQEVAMPDFGIDQARGRVTEAMHAGKWDQVDAQLTAFAAAVRADERHRAIADALAALEDCGGDDGARPVSGCMDAVRRLQ